MKSENAELRLPAYGGQAVIEGVLMRGKRALAMAVRNPQGEIVVFDEQLPPFIARGGHGHPFSGVLSAFGTLSVRGWNT